MFNYKYIVNIKLIKKKKYNVTKQIFYKNSLYKIENYYMNKKQIKKLVDYNYIII
jgi:hypothetical protein